MSPKAALFVASLLSILFLTFHLADDIVRGFDGGGPATMIGVLLLVVWLYGTVALAERRAGYIVLLLMSVLGAGVPVIHMTGAGLGGGRLAHTSGHLFFVWTLVGLGVTSTLSIVLAAQGLWKLARGRSRPAPLPV